jgi:quaternary ammonium compound-resistance protein SugE
VVWAFSMKLSDGFSKPVPTVVTLVTMIGSFALLSLAMRSLPLGTAYTIWTGIGAVGAFVVGIVVLGETLSVARVLAAVLIVSGLLLMKLSSSS